MKNLFVIVLLFISNLVCSQSFKRINDDEFSFKANNQAIVLWKIRIVDNNSKQFLKSNLFPFLGIIKYDNVMTKKWDTPINAGHAVYDRHEKGVWKKEGNKTVYERIYLLETKPKKAGYYFESLYLPFTVDAKDEDMWRYPEIPVFRKIAPENNKFYNYGTIEVNIDHQKQTIFVNLINDDTEKTNLLNYARESYPNVYSNYKDKISDDVLKFYFVVRVDHSSSLLKNFSHYWTVLHGNGIEGQGGSRITFNSKKNGQSLQTHMVFNEIDLPLNFDITYKSEWKKGETDRPFGLFIGNSAENKYLFQTTANGRSGIEGTCNGTNEVFEISNEIVFTGKANKKNDYRIEVRNKKATYYINNIEIGSCKLNADLSKACFIGFLVKDKQKVFFDELQITEP